MESRETRGMVSRQFNLIEIQLECLQTMKNNSFYRAFDRNRPIVSIEGYNETSTMDHFGKCHGRPILINGPDASVRLNVKNALICAPWIAIGRS